MKTEHQKYGELKVKTGVSLTKTAMSYLDKLRKEEQVSRSEMLERLVREKVNPSPLTEKEAMLKN
ncbi:ribbon-helix-helix protein, CopG family [Okeania sp. SIO2B3]|uniref:ribbon-helix-helix protein, CopG family n=1 Tax=Okeania sp. SIO2B3 TaxID=2607784 RepID=UPI0013C13C64|nr:ribbon-helix-helix protein, CopG family [Okeania sp. SIO2B3]